MVNTPSPCHFPEAQKAFIKPQQGSDNERRVLGDFETDIQGESPAENKGRRKNKKRPFKTEKD